MLFTVFPLGTSSDSEEEIVFQRKNRKKMNVLASPDVSLRGKTKIKKKNQNDREVKHQNKNPLCIDADFCLHRLRTRVILSHRFEPSENVGTRFPWSVSALGRRNERVQVHL